MSYVMTWRDWVGIAFMAAMVIVTVVIEIRRSRRWK